MTGQVVFLLLLALLGFLASRRNRKNHGKEALHTGGMVLSIAAILTLGVLGIMNWLSQQGPADAAPAPRVDWEKLQWNWEKDVQPSLLKPKGYQISNKLLPTLYDELDELWRNGKRSKGLDLAHMILNIAPKDPVATAAIEMIEQATLTQEARANLTHIPTEYHPQLMQVLSGTRYQIVRIEHDGRNGRENDKITLRQLSPGWLHASEVMVLRSQLDKLGTALGDTFTVKTT